MTEQIRDTLIFNDDKYEPFLYDGGEPLFVPELHGLSPKWTSTACYRGYQATYEVIYNRIYLIELYVNLFDLDLNMKIKGEKKGPMIHYSEPEFTEGFLSEFNNHYELRYPLDFTGSLLVGQKSGLYPYVCDDAYVKEYEEEIGSIFTWPCESLYRLHFKDGKLMRCEDMHEKNAPYREQIKKLMAEEGQRRIDALEQSREKGRDIFSDDDDVPF